MVGGTDPDELKFSKVTRITGDDERYAAAVVFEDGQARLATTATVSVRQVSGRDNFADVWFWIGDKTSCGGVGAVGDTIRVQIVAGCDPILFPAIDVTYTIQASDLTADDKELRVAENIATALNNNLTFATLWRAQRIINNGIVHISSRVSGEAGERTGVDAFLVTTTGTTTVLRAFDQIQLREKVNSLTRDPTDPRTGTLGISGTVNFTPGTISNLLFQDCTNGALTPPNGLSVNGSVTPITFSVNATAGFDLFITDVVLHGRSNGIKFGQFLNINSKLTNGILFDIKSDNQDADLPVVRSTDDLKARFSTIGGFSLDIQAGGDHFSATRSFGLTPIVVRKQGAFGPGNDDYFRVIIRDNVASVSELFCTVNGFRREF